MILYPTTYGSILELLGWCCSWLSVPGEFPNHLEQTSQTKSREHRTKGTHFKVCCLRRYVILEPGEDEKFVTPEELQQTLENALTSWWVVYFPLPRNTDSPLPKQRTLIPR
jgi:hypothetical protein